ncbi:MAG: hypothetical protein WD712_03230 [Candidatus Spechtbacterales bacterium]
MFRAFGKVFSNTGYLLLFLWVSGKVYILSVLFPNFSFIKAVFASSAPIEKKAIILASLTANIGANNSLFSIVIIIAISVLFAVNFAMIVFMIRKNRSAVYDKGKGNLLGISGGLITGALGIGCAACGSLILTPVAISIGATGILAALPYGGTEFGFLGIGLFMVSIYSLSKKINDPAVCPID